MKGQVKNLMPIHNLRPTWRAKPLVVSVLAAILLTASLGVFGGLPQATRAVDRGTAEAAITLAAAHPAFMNVLGGRPGWTAAAYDSGNNAGIWRVQFWAVDGEDLGWADVSILKGRVYAMESNVGATEAQKVAVADRLIAFLAKDPTVRDLIGNPADYESWLDYNGWVNTWYVYINKGGGDSLYIGIANDADDLMNLTNLRIVQIYFPEVQSYPDWEGNQKAKAVSMAFATAEIAALLRSYEGWTADTVRVGNNAWQVTFKTGEKALATATVDLDAGQVLEFTITVL
jgi:hypothetical protein